MFSLNKSYLFRLCNLLECLGPCYIALALPAELRAHIGHFSSKKVAKNGFSGYSFLRGKSGKSDEKLERKIGPVMEVHMDAKRHLNLFCMISNYLWCFPISFSFFPPLFRPLISMCCTTVFGASCGQKRSPALAGVFRRQGRGAFFMPLAVWIVPLKAGLGKSFLCRPCLRNWGAVNK